MTPDLKNRTVLQVTPALDAGGVERTTVEIAAAITGAGGRALVASEGGRLEDELHAAGGELIRLPLAAKDLRLFTNAQALRALIHGEKVDLVHARSRAPAWSALWAARAENVPFVTTYHGVYNGRSALKRLYNGVMARGDRVIANSQFTADHLIAAHGTDPERVSVIHRGVDLARLDPDAITAEALTAQRDRWQIAPDQRVMLLPGRLTRWKGQLVAIEALALARPELPGDVVLVIIGDAQGRDGYVGELNAAIDAHQLGERARLAGHETDMARAYACADVVLSTSTEPEAFGRVAVEAQAMGVPVIATDHGGARETVLAAHGGVRVAPGDSMALARAMIEHFNQSGQEREQQRSKIRDWARQNWSIATMQAKTLDLYQRVLTGKA